MESKLLKEIIESLKHVRCYSLIDILTDYQEGKINADEAEQLLIEFNTEFKISIDIDPETKEVVRYNEFIKIGETEQSVYVIKNIAKTKTYSFKNNEVKYGILVNKASNDFNPFNNQLYYYNSKKERDRMYLILKDVMAVAGNVRFN